MMDWVILALIMLIAAAAGTLGLIVWDYLRDAEDREALDEFDAWFLWNHGRRPTPLDYVNYLYPETKEDT